MHYSMVTMQGLILLGTVVSLPLSVNSFIHFTHFSPMHDGKTSLLWIQLTLLRRCSQWDWGHAEKQNFSVRWRLSDPRSGWLHNPFKQDMFCLNVSSASRSGFQPKCQRLISCSLLTEPILWCSLSYLWHSGAETDLKHSCQRARVRYTMNN